MSADNGIYILKTKDQYRVNHLQAIDNITWSIVGMCHKDYVPARIVEMFGDCRYTRNKKIAHDIAMKRESKLHTEYGVHIIEYDKTWAEIVEDAVDCAKIEIGFAKLCDFYNEKEFEQLQRIADGKYF